jgi:hypothetical protein
MPSSNRYLDEVILYGDESYTRAEAILGMQRLGVTRGMIDRSLQGYEHAQHLRERSQRVTFKPYLSPD